MRSPARLLAVTLAAFASIVALSTIAHADVAHWRLPWRAGEQVYVTQDCNDSCCSDHVGRNEYAWDFATHGAFEVVAPRAGTIVHVKMSSNHGGDSSAVDSANYLVIDHGDGTASILLHLARGSLDPALQCGSFVRQGQHLATTGATGWASGNHLHFQVNRIPPSMNRTCECGADGMACGEDESHWELFWSRDEASASVPIEFDDWHGASVCADRHDNVVLTSQNVDSHESLVPVDANAPGRFVPLRGVWELADGGVLGRYHSATSGNEAAAMIPFGGLVTRPGLYEVWTALPAVRRNVGASLARAEVIARGERISQVQGQTAPGGGYRPLTGRFKLTGRPGEGLVLSSFARPAEALSVDGVMLRRIADAGRTASGHACRSSAECAGDMVCASNVCRAGCESAGCGPGEACDATGACLRAASAPSEPNEVATTRQWFDTQHAPIATWNPPRVLASIAHPPTGATGGGASDPATRSLNVAAPAVRPHGRLPWFGAVIFGAMAAVARRRH